MPPKKERRPAGDRTALGDFDNITGCGFNRPGLDRKQEAPDTLLFQQLADLRFRHAVEWLHQPGPRALYELLVELGRDRLIRNEIERQVKLYAALHPAILQATGGDRFPAAPLHFVHE